MFVNTNFLVNNSNCQKKNVNPLDYKNVPKLNILNKDTVSFTATQNDASNLDDSKIPELVKQFTRKIIQLNIQNGRITPKELDKIICEFIPEGTDVMLQHTPREQMGASAFCATGFDPKGKMMVGLFVDFNVYGPDLIKDLAHEFTHVLQAFTPEQEKLLRDSMARGEENHFKLEEASNSLEDKILYVINEVLPPIDDEINKLLMGNKATLDEIIDIYELVDNSTFDKDMKNVLSQLGIKEDKFVLKVLYNKAVRESQAYAQGNDALKKANNFSEMTYTFDLLPKLYERWAEFIKNKLDKANLENQKPLMLFA